MHITNLSFYLGCFLVTASVGNDKNAKSIHEDLLIARGETNGLNLRLMQFHRSHCRFSPYAQAILHMMKLNGIDGTVTAVMSYFNSENLSENFPLYNNPEGISVEAVLHIWCPSLCIRFARIAPKNLPRKKRLWVLCIQIRYHLQQNHASIKTTNFKRDNDDTN